jgi:hypothetical protein
MTPRPLTSSRSESRKPEPVILLEMLREAGKPGSGLTCASLLLCVCRSAGNEIYLYVVPATNLLLRSSRQSQEVSGREAPWVGCDRVRACNTVILTDPLLGRHRPTAYWSKTQRPKMHYEVIQNTHRQDTHRQDTHRQDTHQQDTYRQDTYRQDTHR